MNTRRRELDLWIELDLLARPPVDVGHVGWRESPLRAALVAQLIQRGWVDDEGAALTALGRSVHQRLAPAWERAVADPTLQGGCAAAQWAMGAVEDGAAAAPMAVLLRAVAILLDRADRMDLQLAATEEELLVLRRGATQLIEHGISDKLMARLKEVLHHGD